MAKSHRSHTTFEGNTKYQSELVDSSPRAAVIFAAAVIDHNLGCLLEAFLVEDKVSSNAIWEGSNSFLKTFSDKVDACFCLGLITKDEYDDITKIRKIRNDFAHQIEGCDFESESVKARCNDLKYVGKNPGVEALPARQKFSIAIYLLESIFKSRIQSIRDQKRTILPNVHFSEGS